MNLSPMAVGCRSMIYLSSHKPTKALHALILAMATALLIGGSAMAAKANRALPPSLPPASQAGPLPQALHEDEKKQDRITRQIKALADDIPDILASDAEYPLNGTLLHATLSQGKVYVTIFKHAEDGSIICRWGPVAPIAKIMLVLAKVTESKAAWLDMTYYYGSKRKAAIEITDATAKGASTDRLVRRHVAARRFYRKKPIFCDALPDNVAALQPYPRAAPHLL